MKLLIFDVETTGLIKGRNANVSETHKFPYIVQFSWITYDTETKEMCLFDNIIKLPNNKTIPEDSIKIHGITNEKMMKEGKDIKKILYSFTDSVYRSDVLIAHNLQFDKRVIQSEYIRNNMIDWLARHRKNEYCTMKKGKNICKIYKESRYGNTPYMKYPKLMELHKHLFNTCPKNLHNSLVDVITCLRCYYKINYNKDLLDNKKCKSLYFRLCGI